MKTFLKETEPNIFSLWQAEKKQEIRIETLYKIDHLIEIINNRRQGIFNAHDIKWAVSFGICLESGLVLPDYKNHKSNTDQFISSLCNGPWEVKIESENVYFI